MRYRVCSLWEFGCVGVSRVEARTECNRNLKDIGKFCNNSNFHGRHQLRTKVKDRGGGAAAAAEDEEKDEDEFENFMQY